MELREFAERVLFATSLREKLAGPETPVTDGSPGKAIDCPERPGRPGNLIFSRGESGLPLPRGPGLEDERQRAVLLHFFANHELLATELMALVLLRFPDAPAEFRQGLYRTLREEQRHTTLYMKRLEECGLSFGELPVNRYFWDAVASVPSPLDYVARLSLTFEQANLDYSLYYAEVFSRAGDERTAKILRAICRDEVGHVRYGLEWFRRWRDPAATDWEAFHQVLSFPLSPSRAKANGYAPFNRQGRLAAGLDADFVRQLELFERSKGRTPRVLWFYPGAEESAAGGKASMAEREPKARGIAESLEGLMIFACRRDDVLLLRRLPDVERLETLRRAGFVLPELEKLGEDGGLDPASILPGRKIAELRPWAWCPPAVTLFAPLEAGLPASAPKLADCWNAEIRALHQKSTHQAFLAEFLQAHAVPGVDPSVVGQVARDGAELRSVIEGFRRAGFEQIVLKTPLAAAAKGNRLCNGPADVVWAERVMERQGAIVVEPWLDRVWDFSVQFEMGRDGLRRLDLIELENNARGQFRAVSSAPRLTPGLEPELARFLHGSVFPLYEGALKEFLECRLQEVRFTGPIGIDAFVYRSGQGELRCKPVVEINPRYTMGRIAHEIRQQVAPGCSIRLELVRQRRVGKDEAFRLDPASGRVEWGRLALSGEGGVEGFWAELTVGKTRKDNIFKKD